MADIYQRQVRPDVAPLRQRDPAAYQDPVMAGIGGVGDALQRDQQAQRQHDDVIAASEARIAARERERAQARIGADVGVGLELLRGRFDAEANRRRTAPSRPDGAGHAQGMEDWLLPELDKVAELIGDDAELADRFAPSFARLRAQLISREEAFEIDQSARYQGQQAETFTNLRGNALAATPLAQLPQALDGTLKDGEAFFDSQALEGATRDKVYGAYRGQMIESALDAAIAQGRPDAARGWLESGAFDAYMTPDEKRQQLGRIGAAERAAQVQAEQAQSQARSAARDAIQAVDAKRAIGILPDAREVRAARAAAVAAGVPADEIIRFDGGAIADEVNRRYATASADQILAVRDGLNAKMGAGTASEQEQVVKRQLDKLYDARIKTETAELKTLAGQGTQGTLQALGRIGGAPETRYRKAEALGAGLGAVAMLPQSEQRSALEGRAARVDRPQDFGTDQQVRTRLNQALGPVAAMLGGRYSDVRQAAWDLYTDRMLKAGRTGWDQQLFDGAIQTVMGQQTGPDGRKVGGVASIGSGPVVIPDWQTANEFERALRGLKFTGATYADGKTAAPADVIAKYRPEFIGDNEAGYPVYRFVSPMGEPLRLKSGRHYAVTLSPEGAKE